MLLNVSSAKWRPFCLGLIKFLIMVPKPVINVSMSGIEHVTFMSFLNALLGYSTGELQALQLIVLAVFGVVD